MTVHRLYLPTSELGDARGLLNRYIKYENAGDMFVGKCVSGRSRNSVKFAASLSYWDFSDKNPENREAQKEALKLWLISHLPEQAKENKRIYAVHAMLMAAIAYHRNYLDDHLHPDSILCHSSIWNNDILFEDKVVVKYPWEATEDTPKIIGLPPDIVLLAKVESMKLEVTALKEQLEANFLETLINQVDQREVDRLGFARGNEIVEKLDAVLKKVSEVSHPAPAPAGASALPVAEAMLELGQDDRDAFYDDDEEEEDIVIGLDDPEHMPPRKRVRIIRS